jgi:protein-tyrosine phosphatase
MKKVLFVCLGNICRSPTAEGVFRTLLETKGVDDWIQADSAGTSNWHPGKAPDPRTIVAAKTRGYDLSMLRARQVNAQDFEHFDYILAMDNANLRELQQQCPSHFAGHLGLFLDFASSSKVSEVPDPYYGGTEGFDLVLDLIEDASEGLINHLLKSSAT